MALRFIDGFDHYQTADLLKKYTGMSTWGPDITTSGRTGSGLIFQNIDHISKTLDDKDTWIIGAAVKCTESDAMTLFSIWDDGTKQVHLGVSSSGKLSVVRGSTILATSTKAISADIWYYIELKVKISTTVGEYEVRVNNEIWISGSEANTDAAESGVANVIRLGTVGGLYIAECYMDDLYICDGAGSKNNDFLGDCRVVTMYPNADGTTSQWAAKAAGDHYAEVDEAANNFPDEETSYISHDTAGEIDLFEMTALGYDDADTDVLGAQVNLCAKKSDTGERTIKPVVRYDGSNYPGTLVYPSETSYAYFCQQYDALPDPGATAWTCARADAIEVGVELES